MNPKTGDRLVGNWLLAIAAMIFGMVVGGGYVRTVDAGFALQVWKPIVGFLPPVSDAGWKHLFALYQRTPQFQSLHPAMTLTQFKAMAWPNILDRDWGRLTGIAFIIPLAVFRWQHRISNRLTIWLLFIFSAGAAEATMGWYMVRSAMSPGTLSPSPLWLASHFVLAMMIFSAVLWAALSIRNPVPVPVEGSTHLRPWLTTAIALIIAAMSTGSLVAATGANRVYNTFPLMNGHVMPQNAWALHPLWLNLVANQGTVQFEHRALATAATVVVLIAAVQGLRVPTGTKARDLFLLLALSVSLQYILGMTALVSGMNSIGYSHELNAVLVLAACIACRHTVRGTNATIPYLVTKAAE